MPPSVKIFRGTNYYWAKMNYAQLVALCCYDITVADIIVRHSVIDVSGDEPIYLVRIPDYAILWRTWGLLRAVLE